MGNDIELPAKMHIFNLQQTGLVVASVWKALMVGILVWTVGLNLDSLGSRSECWLSKPVLATLLFCSGNCIFLSLSSSIPPLAIPSLTMVFLFSVDALPSSYQPHRCTALILQPGFVIVSILNFWLSTKSQQVYSKHYLQGDQVW